MSDEEVGGWFLKHDTDQSGTLSQSELMAMLKDLEPGVQIDNEPVDMICAAAQKALGDDATASGTQIPAHYMKTLVLKFRSWLVKRKQLESMFAQADVDGSNSLQVSELRALLQKAAPAGYAVSDSDAQHVLSRCDIDSSGAIEINELGPVIALWVETAKSIQENAAYDEADAKKSSICALL